jgi:hypothetical protein
MPDVVGARYARLIIKKVESVKKLPEQSDSPRFDKGAQLAERVAAKR